MSLIEDQRVGIGIGDEQANEMSGFTPPDPNGPRVQLGEAVRHLSGLIVTKELDDAISASVTSKVLSILEEFEGRPDRAPSVGQELEELKLNAGLFNPVIGRANPLAPPMDVTIAKDGVVTLTGILDRRSEGPPGCVHGGLVATLLDQALGHANAAIGIGAFTAEITTRFVKPTPLDVSLIVKAKAEAPVRRTIRGNATLEVAGEVTATAQGIFVTWEGGQRFARSS